MNQIEEIAKKYQLVDENTSCRCNAEHVFCLNCTKCRAMEEDKIPTDFENLCQYIDHTILKPDALSKDIIKLCEEANTFNFKSVCVNPCHVKLAKQHIKSSKICSVVGFPLGCNDISVKMVESVKAISDGANEVDLVQNIAAIKEFNDVSSIQNMNEFVQKLCFDSNIILKIIIETCLLNFEEIVLSSLIAKKCGADFVKTSTGFSTKGADVEDVKLIRRTVGNKMGVKASGGIRTKDDAIAMLKAGANRLGMSNSMSCT